jgi:hypothetical protein
MACAMAGLSRLERAAPLGNEAISGDGGAYRQVCRLQVAGTLRSPSDQFVLLMRCVGLLARNLREGLLDPFEQDLRIIWFGKRWPRFAKIARGRNSLCGRSRQDKLNTNPVRPYPTRQRKAVHRAAHSNVAEDDVHCHMRCLQDGDSVVSICDLDHPEATFP